MELRGLAKGTRVRDRRYPDRHTGIVSSIAEEDQGSVVWVSWYRWSPWLGDYCTGITPYPADEVEHLQLRDAQPIEGGI